MNSRCHSAIICKLSVRSSNVEPCAYVPDSVFLDAPACIGGADARRRGDNVQDVQGSCDGGAELACDADSARNGSLRRLAPLQGDMPEKSLLPCQWCLHTFDSPPVGLPVRKNSDGKFDVVGVFCSLECASAFNFDREHASHAAYTRHAMCCEIASVSSEGTKPVNIRPAPAREMLKMFGGPMSITEFRNSDTPYTIVYPLPIVAHPQHSEELALASTESVAGPRFVPIDEETIDSLTSGLRRPPVSKRGFKSTLDYMCAPTASA